MLYGKDWKKMQPLIKTRTLVQIRTHAQKVFKKVGLKKIDQKMIREQIADHDAQATSLQNTMPNEEEFDEEDDEERPVGR